MPLLGTAAMLLTFDIADDAIAEHDDWHTHEHLPERLAIPGFLRGTRWVAYEGAPRYAVLYEVERLQTLDSPPYLERLNHPTPWTSRMMVHYRGMSRGLCTVEQSCGLGMGHFALVVRFRRDPAATSAFTAWLRTEVMPQIPARPGLGSVHLLAGALTPAMTSEQRIRGTDGGVDGALIVTGYRREALAALARTDLGTDVLAARGAADVVATLYEGAYSLTADEVGARRAGPTGES